ncbi:MAG: hypothetical protein GY869_29535, partial [Planctomycetes bacterium]|nr:hypothetical protein [Planctomycetota bacterium]
MGETKIFKYPADQIDVGILQEQGILYSYDQNGYIQIEVRSFDEALLVKEQAELPLSTGDSGRGEGDSIRDSGGPDGGGYYYIDSTEPCGPAYAFEDITNTGTLVAFASANQVLGAFPIGFTFNFYGVNYTGVYISSNGFLTFLAGQSDGCCSGQAIPTTGNPDGLIAGWWEDYNTPIGGQVLYETIGFAPNRKFIVQFTGINHATYGTNVTMQFKLFEGTNTIEVHYANAPSDGGTHSAGIEDQTGTNGTQYYFGTTGLGMSLAVAYYTDNATDTDGDCIV